MKRVTVGVNDFVRRQIKGSGKTYSSLSYQEIAGYAENEINNKNFEKGYRDGVVVIKLKKELVDKFHCPFYISFLYTHHHIYMVFL